MSRHVALLKLLHVQVLLLCVMDVERQRHAMKSCVFVVGLGVRIAEQVMSLDVQDGGIRRQWLQ